MGRESRRNKREEPTPKVVKPLKPKDVAWRVLPWSTLMENIFQLGEARAARARNQRADVAGDAQDHDAREPDRDGRASDSTVDRVPPPEAGGARDGV